MKVGITLPTVLAGAEGKLIVEWARAAEQAGFSTLGCVDRLVYRNHDTLIALGAAAAVTERIRLMPSVLLAPLHANHVLLAKQVATIDAISGGRFTLAVGIGARDDDYQASGLSTDKRGAVLDRQLATLKKVWSGESYGFAGAVGPTPAQPGGPKIIVGGFTPAAFARVARWDGWMMGGSTAEQFRGASQAVDAAWSGAGRAGKCWKATLHYCALGADAAKTTAEAIKHYYAWAGPYADAVLAGASKDEATLKAQLAGYANAGCDEVVLVACSSDLRQIELLAKAAGL